MTSFAIQVLTYRAFRKDNINFRTIEKSEKIILINQVFIAATKQHAVHFTKTSPYKSDPRFAPYILYNRGKAGVSIKTIKSGIFSIK